MDVAAEYGMDGGRKLFIACVHALVCIALAFGDEQCFRAGKQSRTVYPLLGLVLARQA